MGAASRCRESTAEALRLITSLLDTKALRYYISICDSLGISALVEIHDESEVESALSAGARLIGVNNCNLRDFSVDINNCIRLRASVPNTVLFVAESGIKDSTDIQMLRENGVDAVLIGETLMRAPDKTEKLLEQRGNL